MITGRLLNDSGSATAKVINGQGGEPRGNSAVVVHVQMLGEAV